MNCACQEKAKKRLLDKGFYFSLARIVASTVLALLGFFVFSEARFGLWVNFAFMGTAWLLCAYDIAYEAFKAVFLKKEPFDENALMLIASIGAFCLRFFGPEDNEFLEATMVVILFQIGELFEHLATEKSHQAIEAAVGLRAQTANLIEGGGLKSVKPSSLRVGDHIIVKTGEIVPADGTIEEGSGLVDMSSLTGEFVPVIKNEGESVSSGTILKEGSFRVRVRKTYENSTVAQIIRLVDESAKSKSDADRFIDRFSRVYTPTMVVLALLVAVLPPLFLGISDGAVWAAWVYRALCFLVISCPCAIVISVPLAYFAGIGLASKRGIIVKGSSFFDKLNRLSWVVTDKTGTLTYGDFRITKTVSPKIKTVKFMEYFRAVELRSTHPVAVAIEKTSGDSIEPSLISGVKEYAGLGSSCLFQGHRLLAGNGRLFAKKGIAVPAIEEVGTMVYLAVDGVYEGYVVLNDVIRTESLSMVDGLRELGIRTSMLTGDREAGALAVATTLGIDEHHSGLLPEDKQRILGEKIHSSSGCVAYIGDGINDAPSIALADVGVAMGGIGSDVAIGSADVVIMNDDPSKIVTAVKIAKKAKNRSIFNIIIALIVKLTIMVLAAFLPGFPLLAAVLADTGLTVLLVLNSISLLRSGVR
ncbi:MAG: heavy metal translocating P-type ATPase [Bacilli bacterium]|jgi:Cd2+/Zn2+-exporting ATPase|nr:heavy metal translocating P-type ATPase [Bacilli bacterium]